MGVKLSKMKSVRRETSLTWDGEDVAFCYKPNEYTLDVESSVHDAGQAGDIAAVSNLLEPVIEWWDVLDEDGQRIPPTAENMRQFPLRFLVAVMGQVDKDQSPESEG